VSEPLEIAGLTGTELHREAKARLPRGAGLASALYRDALGKGRFAPELHGLGAKASEAWRASFRLSLPKVLRVVEEDSPNGTVAKAVLSLHDGLQSECVLLPMRRATEASRPAEFDPDGLPTSAGDRAGGAGTLPSSREERSTLCISSQVGCKMGCSFCETGRMGLLRNLTTAEILGQLLCARHVLAWPYDNVVFMGMGEALDNRDAVLQALRVMTDGSGFGMGQEHITVCTVGNVPGIEALAAAGFKRLNLSVSLNAARDELRSQLMPVNRRTKLAELQRALASYRPRANFALGVNYCLLPGINDTRQDASDVAKFCAPLGRVMVNVIPYNPGSAPIATAPTEETIDGFIGWLREEGLPVRRRITKGRSVMAACGQLGNVELRRSSRAR